MKNNERMAGEFTTSATVGEILASTGIQLARWSYDIAFTDAAFGETWAVEQANRMASLSELLNVVYKSLPRRIIQVEIQMPEGMIGQIAINPGFEPDSALDGQDDQSKAAGNEGMSDSLPDFPDW